VIFLSHCLLNENVRYLGGAARASGVSEVVNGYLASGVGICQMPCPEQRAWGGCAQAADAAGVWLGRHVQGAAGPAAAPPVHLVHA
jgi:hypothetical protein